MLHYGERGYYISYLFLVSVTKWNRNRTITRRRRRMNVITCRYCTHIQFSQCQKMKRWDLCFVDTAKNKWPFMQEFLTVVMKNCDLNWMTHVLQKCIPSISDWAVSFCRTNMWVDEWVLMDAGGRNYLIVPSFMWH